jgi:hypothetical protein
VLGRVGLELALQQCVLVKFLNIHGIRCVGAKKVAGLTEARCAMADLLQVPSAEKPRTGGFSAPAFEV